MIVTDRFVFLHLHKSGGTFVGRALQQAIPGARALGYHLPRQYIPDDFRQLPILGTVRNPWAYYVSWHSFQSNMAQPNPVFMVCSEGRQQSFAGTIRNLLGLHDDPQRLDTLIQRLPVEFPNRGINLTRQCMAPLAGSGLGFYSFMYRRMYGDLSNTTLLDTVNLANGLLDYLDDMQVPVSEQARGMILRSPPANATTHEAYHRYYDDDLRELVARSDAEVIDRHGYQFPLAE